MYYICSYGLCFIDDVLSARVHGLTVLFFMFVEASFVVRVLVLELFLVLHGHALEIVYAEQPICPDVVVFPFPNEHPCCFLVIGPP